MAKNPDATADSAAAEASLTVEQLAYETGMSVRNIRNHQSRGLLPPPEVRARVGYYGPEHVARLNELSELDLLYDRDGAGEFVHFFTRTLGNVFFEVVERRGGYDGSDRKSVV